MNLKEQEDFNKPPYISSPLKNKKKKTPPTFSLYLIQTRVIEHLVLLAANKPFESCFVLLSLGFNKT
jgi:hypothetical protein